MPRPHKIWDFNALSYQVELAVDPNDVSRLVLSHKSRIAPYWNGISLGREELEKLNQKLGAWLYGQRPQGQSQGETEAGSDCLQEEG